MDGFFLEEIDIHCLNFSILVPKIFPNGTSGLPRLLYYTANRNLGCRGPSLTWIWTSGSVFYSSGSQYLDLLGLQTRVFGTSVRVPNSS